MPERSVRSLYWIQSGSLIAHTVPSGYNKQKTHTRCITSQIFSHWTLVHGFCSLSSWIPKSVTCCVFSVFFFFARRRRTWLCWEHTDLRPRWGVVKRHWGRVHTVTDRRHIQKLWTITVLQKGYCNPSVWRSWGHRNPEAPKTGSWEKPKRTPI